MVSVLLSYSFIRIFTFFCLCHVKKLFDLGSLAASKNYLPSNRNNEDTYSYKAPCHPCPDFLLHDKILRLSISRIVTHAWSINL